MITDVQKKLQVIDYGTVLTKTVGEGWSYPHYKTMVTDERVRIVKSFTPPGNSFQIDSANRWRAILRLNAADYSSRINGNILGAGLYGFVFHAATGSAPSAHLIPTVIVQIYTSSASHMFYGVSAFNTTNLNGPSINGNIIFELSENGNLVITITNSDTAKYFGSDIENLYIQSIILL